MQIQSTDTLFDTLCESPKTISFLHRSYIIPISFFRFIYHFYISGIFRDCRRYIIPISFFRFLHHCYIKKEKCYINPISLGLSGELLQQNKFFSKNKGGFPPHVISHIYHFPLHNLLCGNPSIIYKTNLLQRIRVL